MIPTRFISFRSSARKVRQPSPTALTEFVLDGVTAFQGSVQAFGGIRHEDKMRVRCGEGQRNWAQSLESQCMTFSANCWLSVPRECRPTLL